MSSAAPDVLLDALLDRVVAPRDTLTLGRLGSLVLGLARLIESREMEELTLKELEMLLVGEGVAAMPFSTAVDLLETVAPAAHHHDVVGQFTVRQLELLLDDAPL